MATSPRTGGWLLCELLESTGIAGHPGEYGCRADIATWRAHHGCATHAEYFFRFPTFMTTRNGVFGTKLVWPQWLCLAADAKRYLGRSSGAFLLLDSLAGPLRIIRLRRRDTVRQAVSLARAQRTGEWARRAGNERPAATATASTDEYDRVAVRDAHAALRWQESEWDRELSGLAVPILELEYEAVIADIDGTVASVLRFLGLPDNVPSLPPRLRRQSDEQSEAWVRRARQDLG